MQIVIDYPAGTGPRSAAMLEGQLVDELARARVAVRPTQAAPAEGQKGAGHSLTELVMTGGLSAAAVSAVASIIVGFVQRGAARRILMRDGDRELEVTGVSSREAKMALEAFLQRTAQNRPEEPM